MGTLVIDGKGIVGLRVALSGGGVDVGVRVGMVVGVGVRDGWGMASISNQRCVP